jgi:hypothetical protein
MAVERAMRDKESVEQVKRSFRWGLAGLIDGFFLVFWVAIQFGVNWAISLLPLSGIDQWVLIAFQVLFAITTVAPPAIYAYRDIRIMWIRASRDVDREEAGGLAHE